MSLFTIDAFGADDANSHNKIAYTCNAFAALEDENGEALPINNNDDENAEESAQEEYDAADFFGLPPPNVNIAHIIDAALTDTQSKKTKVDAELELSSELVNAAAEKAKARVFNKRKRIINIDYSDFNAETGKFAEERLVQSERQKCAEGALNTKACPKLSQKNARKLHREQRDKTKGSSWYNLPATEMTEEVENDLKILQMRSVLDPKHFYKKNDFKVLPKYFQIGTVQHSALDYYSERGTRKNKQNTIVDELLADAQVQQFTKRKYKEALLRKDKYAHRKTMKKMKKLKKSGK